MFEVDIERHFSAAHSLRGYNGDCSKLHGHNWTVNATIQAEKLDDIGIAVDFKKLKKELDVILDLYDHSNVNEHSDFSLINPTSENIAKSIYHKLSERINTENVKVYKIRVCETPGSGATYYE